MVWGYLTIGSLQCVSIVYELIREEKYLWGHACALLTVMQQKC